MAKSHGLIDDRRPQLPSTNMFRFMSSEPIMMPPSDDEADLVFETAREIQEARLAKRKALMGGRND